MPQLILAIFAFTYLTLYFLSLIASSLIYPAYFYEYSDHNPMEPTVIPGNHSKEIRPFHMIFLSGNGVPSYAAHSEHDVEQCTKIITDNNPYSTEYFHPGYSRKASNLVDRLVARVVDLTQQHPGSRIILAGWSLGGGISMQAALKLHKCGIEVDVINARSFSSIGGVVVSLLGLDPNRFYNRPLRAGLNSFLWMLGGWNLDSQSALEQLSKTRPLTVPPVDPTAKTLSSTLLPLDPTASSQLHPPKIHITSWGAADEIIGHAFLRTKDSMRDVTLHDGTQTTHYVSPGHTQPVPVETKPKMA